MSKAIEFLNQAGWQYRESGVDQVVALLCPLCGNANHKFYICSAGEKDGLWSCKVCGESGNLWQLRKRLGMTTQNNTVSMQDAARSSQAPDPIPDIASPHYRLMNDETFGEVLDYLVADRGLSVAVLNEHKIGVETNRDGAKWIVYPYLDANGACTFVKYRKVPPCDKNDRFRALRGRETPLFNEKALKPSMDILLLCEGEVDTLTLLSQGIEPVVGLPGAGMKKATWIDRFDQLAPKDIVLIYDTDKPGQEAARDMASRIGIEKVRNLVLPPFETVDGNPGKDVNEWFKAGHTMAEFNELVASAKPFNVDGVQSLPEVLQELHDQFTEKGTEPTLKTQWDSVNKKIGGFEWGDLVGVLAGGKTGKTTWALNLLNHFAFNGYTSFMYCNEMKPVRMVRKWVSMVTQTPDSPDASKITPDTVKTAIDIIPSYKADLLFGYTKMPDKPIDSVLNTIRQTVRRYGVKVVCFDNLHLLVRSLEHSVQEISNMTKRFKDLAMELNILLILILQPRRVQEGKIVSGYDANGSSAIEKDVDCMLCLHRNRVGVIKESDFNGIMETDESFEPFMLVRADLSRYSAGGTCTLYMDGATSTIKELTPDQNRPQIHQQEGIQVAA